MLSCCRQILRSILRTPNPPPTSLTQRSTTTSRIYITNFCCLCDVVKRKKRFSQSSKNFYLISRLNIFQQLKWRLYTWRSVLQCQWLFMFLSTQWNPNFFNYLWKSKLVRIIERFEKSEVKLHCWLVKGSWFGSNYREFRKTAVSKNGVFTVMHYYKPLDKCLLPKMQ